MVQDPGQSTDVARQNPEVTARLSAAVRAWREDVLAGYGREERPFVIGHREFRYTQIPARDGKPHGNIKRSNRFPNNSF
jgi:hypothetical protein